MGSVWSFGLVGGREATDTPPEVTYTQVHNALVFCPSTGSGAGRADWPKERAHHTHTRRSLLNICKER